MITLTFIKNRTNAESFVIQIQRALAEISEDFVRAAEHGIDKVELKSDSLNLSSDNGDITFKDTYVYSNGRQVQATEFTVKVGNAQLLQISEPTVMEMVVNSTERIAFVTIKTED